MTNEAPTAKGAAKGCLVLLAVVTVIGGVIAAVVLSLRAGGDEVARVAVYDAPASAPFRLDVPSEVTLWTDLDVTHGDISAQASNDELPHVLDYAVTITRDGQRVAELLCNPFDSNFARTSAKRSSMGEPSGRSYDGLLNGCAFDAPPGSYVVTARRQWRMQDPRVSFRKTELILRAKKK